MLRSDFNIPAATPKAKNKIGGVSKFSVMAFKNSINTSHKFSAYKDFAKSFKIDRFNFINEFF